MNFLEELLAEWYEYQGYFVRKNVLVGRRAAGGYECELDVVAFNPTGRQLVHVEASTDTASWATREHRFAKKFEAGRRYIHQIFEGLDLPSQPTQYAVLMYAGSQTTRQLGGCRVVAASDLLLEILPSLSKQRTWVREHYPILRTLQFVGENRKALSAVLSNPGV
jgi:hypothetical protein